MVLELARFYSHDDSSYISYIFYKRCVDTLHIIVTKAERKCLIPFSTSVLEIKFAGERGRKDMIARKPHRGEKRWNLMGENNSDPSV